MPLTHNSQPATQNLPFYCPLKVGSEHEERRNVISDLCFVAVPSRSGRNEALNEVSHLDSIIRRPLKVGSGRGDEIEFDYVTPESPSPQGRVGTILAYFANLGTDLSPSPQGRVGTYAHLGTDIDPLLVAVPSRSGRDNFVRNLEHVTALGRRPLKVGSGQVKEKLWLFNQLRSPSPQGRVGTGTGNW